MNRRLFASGAALGLGTAVAGPVPAAAEEGRPPRPRTLGGANTAVPDLRVGHSTDPRRPTGCTVVLADDGAVAGARTEDGRRGPGAAGLLLRGEALAALQAGMATTIGVVATDAVLTKAQARKLAQVAHDGLARTIEPSHIPWDGNTLFALATGRSGLPGNMMALRCWPRA